jgi:group I intron endonuclease
VYIYRVTNTVNGKMYVGKSEKPFRPDYLGSGKLITAAIKKYGRDAFTLEVLCKCSDLDDLDTQEKIKIAEHKRAFGRNCYNIAEGGTGGNTTKYATGDVKVKRYEKQAAKMSTWHSTMTEEEKREYALKISNAKCGKKPNMGDYKHSEETKQKQKTSNIEAAKRRPQSWYDNHRSAMQRRRGKMPHNAQPVKMNGIVYECFGKAATAINLTPYLLKQAVKKGEIHLEYL